MPADDDAEHQLDKLMNVEYDDLAPGISADEQATGVRRILQIALGVVLVVAGIAMSFLPGPGAVTILVGLNLIKPDNAIVRWMRRRIPGIPETGTIPRSTIVLGVVLLAMGTAISIIWGPELTQWGRDLIGL